MAELGHILREAREAKGLTLEDVERETRIRHSYLSALESEDFAHLPGDVYIKGFLRNYARFLDLDPAEVLTYYSAKPRTTSTDHKENSRLSLRTPMEVPLEIRVPPRWRWALACVLLLALAGGGWWLYSSGTAAQWLSRLPAVSIPIVFPPTPTSTLPATIATSEGKVETGAATPQPLVATPAPPLATATETATVAPTNTPVPAPTSTPRATPTPTRTVGIVISVEIVARSWLQVFVDGELAYQGTLEVGDTRTWNASRRITMRSGNAGGVLVFVNGEDLGPFGEIGEVVDEEWNVEEAPAFENPTGSGAVADGPVEEITVSREAG